MEWQWAKARGGGNGELLINGLNKTICSRDLYSLVPRINRAVLYAEKFKWVDLMLSSYDHVRAQLLSRV